MMTPCHRDKNFQCHKYLHTSKNQRQLSRKLVLFDCKHEAGSVNSSRKFSQFCDFARGLQTFLPDPEGGRLPDSQPADVTVRAGARAEHNSAFCESSWKYSAVGGGPAWLCLAPMAGAWTWQQAGPPQRYDEQRQH